MTVTLLSGSKGYLSTPLSWVREDVGSWAKRPLVTGLNT